MPQNVTRRQTRGRLAPNQFIALERLLAGDTVTAAAEAARVSRETVHRWKREDCVFLAALNQSLEECQQATLTKLQAASLRASHVIAEAIERGNLKASLAVLKGMGMLSGAIQGIGATDPEGAGFEVRLAEDKRNSDLTAKFILASVPSFPKR